jgi:niacin transporter
MKVKELTLGAVLTALAIVIPMIVFLKIIIPPFTGTLASHVPMFISMFISPTVAVFVGIGSVIGFLISGLPPFVAARAAMHIIVGFVGAVLIKKGRPMTFAFGITIPLHAALEALVVIPFGWTMYESLVTVGLGTAIHHTIDAVLAVPIIYLLKPLIKMNYAGSSR